MKIKNISNASIFVCFLMLYSNLHAQVGGTEQLAVSVDSEVAAVIKAPKTAVLSSQSEGFVTEVHVQEGYSFLEGEVLLSIDCTLQEANLSKSQAQFDYMEKNYESINRLSKLNSASDMQLASSKSEFDKAAAELRTSQYHVDNCEIKAPYDGSVVRSWVNRFETIEAKGKLFDIVNNAELVAEFLVPSNRLMALSKGMNVELRVIETQETYSATIDRIVPHIDSVSQTIKVIGTLNTYEPDLWSGMSGWVVLP